MSFDSYGLTEKVISGIRDLQFEQPTPIQEQCIPLVLAGKDVIASAQTGTGKTAAFVIPILEQILRHPSEQTSVLILTPTRELALQIDEQIFALGYHTGITSVTVYGGADWGRQEKALRDNVNIVVATPGRLIDHMRVRDLDFSGIKFLVLDEADRMLDMGFIPAVQSIVERLPKESRQTLLFSATISPRVEQLAASMLRNPERVNIATQVVASGVEQIWYEVSYHAKVPLLLNLIEEQAWDSTIIFSSTKRDTAALAKTLTDKGLPVVAIHGDRDQAEREEAMRQFRSGKAKFLVATDVVARGIDIDGISHVVNFDVPNDLDDYIHRIGRTARASSTGVAITFCSGRDRRLMDVLVQAMGEKLVQKPLPAVEGIIPPTTPVGASPFRPVRQRHDRQGSGRDKRKPRYESDAKTDRPSGGNFHSSDRSKPSRPHSAPARTDAGTADRDRETPRSNQSGRDGGQNNRPRRQEARSTDRNEKHHGSNGHQRPKQNETRKPVSSAQTGNGRTKLIEKTSAKPVGLFQRVINLFKGSK